MHVLAHALSRAVAARVEAQPVMLTKQNAQKLVRGSAVIIDAFDNLPARAAVSAAAATHNIPCLHIAIGSSGDYGCGLWDAAYPLDAYERAAANTHPADPCDYPLTRPLALLVAAAAAEVLVGYLIDGSQRQFECTLRDLRLVTT